MEQKNLRHYHQDMVRVEFWCWMMLQRIIQNHTIIFGIKLQKTEGINIPCKENGEILF